MKKDFRLLLLFSLIYILFTMSCIIVSACIVVKNPINDYQRLSNTLGYVLLSFSFIFAFTSILFFVIAYIVKNNYEENKKNKSITPIQNSNDKV